MRKEYNPTSATNAQKALSYTSHQFALYLGLADQQSKDGGGGLASLFKLVGGEPHNLRLVQNCMVEHAKQGHQQTRSIASMKDTR